MTPPTVRRFYAIMVTSPQLYSPLVITTLNHFPSAEHVAHLTREQLERQRKNYSLHIHADERPQVHVVPIHIPESQLR
jgi:hypothetical protein